MADDREELEDLRARARLHELEAKAGGGETDRTVVPYANAQAPGMVEQGNVELWNRPAYLHPDYKTSKNYGTTESFSREDEDGKEVLVPQIVDGNRLTQDEAWKHYKDTGQHLGKFDGPDKADQYATALHNAQAMYVDSRGGPEAFVKHDPDSWLSGLPANAVAGGIKAITGIPAMAGWMADRVLDHGRAVPPPMRKPEGPNEVGMFRLPGTSGSPGFSATDIVKSRNSGPLSTASSVGQGVTDYINQSLPVNPDRDVQATNAAERFAQFSGGAITGAMMPFGEATTAQKFGSGARFAVGGGIANELAPDDLKPYVATAGGVGADVGGSFAWRGVKASPLAAAVSDTAARAQGLGKIKRAAGSAEDFEKVKADALAAGQRVPGSDGTFYQDTKNPGIGALEDHLSTNVDSAAFEANRQKQEGSRQDVLNGVQAPKQGSVIDLQQHIAGKIDDADAKMVKVANQYVADAQKNAAAIGGNKSPEAYGDELRKVILKASDERDAVAKKLLESVGADETGNVTSTIDAAKAIRDEAVKNKASLDGDESDLINRAIRLRPVERFGVIRQLQSEISTAMRERLGSKTGADASYHRLSMLRGALEKNLTDTIADVFTGNITSPASSEAAEMMRGLDPADVTAANRDVFDSMAPLPKSETLAEHIAAKGGIQLKDEEAGGRLVKEAQEVNQYLPQRKGGLRARDGQGLTPDKMLEYLRQDRGGWLSNGLNGGHDLQDLYDALAEIRNGKKIFHPDDNTADELLARDRIDREMTEAGIAHDDEPILKAIKLAKYRTNQRSLEDTMPGFEREQTAPPKPTSVVKPTITKEGVESQRKGVAQYKWNRRTFDKGPVGDVTRSSGTSEDHRLPESMVPQKFFKPGPGGFQTMQKLYSAVGKDTAIPIVSDYAASSLNKAARRDDGTIDTAKYGRWKASHSESIRALPPEMQAKFDTAATATEWADEMNVSRETATKEANKGAIGKLVRANTPQEINNVIGGVFDMKIGSRDAMRDLAARARGNPAAAEGLRQGVMDYIKNEFINNQDELVGNRFQDFVHEKADVLGEVLKPNEVENIKAVAADLKHTSAVYKVHGGGPATARRVGYNLPKSSLRVMLDAAMASGGAYALHSMGADTVTSLAAGGAIGAATEGLRGVNAMAQQRVDRVLTRAFTETPFRKELLRSGGSESSKKIMQRSMAGRVFGK